MESSQVKELIGSEVWWEKNKCMADIIDYKSGWVTIKTDDDKEHKVRAKELVLMNTDEDLIETEEGLTTEPMDPSENSSKPASVSAEVGEQIACDHCGSPFVIPKEDTFQCPSCGMWYFVRLKPKMERYIKGLAATPSGRDTLDINDYVAGILRGLDIDPLYDRVCEELNTLDEKAWFPPSLRRAYKEASESGKTCREFLEGRYSHLNAGMQRMNLGNLLRGALNRNEKINNDKEATGEGETREVVDS